MMGQRLNSLESGIEVCYAKAYAGCCGISRMLEVKLAVAVMLGF